MNRVRVSTSHGGLSNIVTEPKDVERAPMGGRGPQNRKLRSKKAEEGVLTVEQGGDLVQMSALT